MSLSKMFLPFFAPIEKCMKSFVMIYILSNTKIVRKLTRKVLRTQDAQISPENMLTCHIKSFRLRRT